MIENLNDKWLAAAGLLGLLLYLSWLYFLLARFRPWLAFQLSKILNATIETSWSWLDHYQRGNVVENNFTVHDRNSFFDWWRARAICRYFWLVTIYYLNP